jgi:gamma-glutamyltranspeptidase/glutathione hydrolase
VSRAAISCGSDLTAQVGADVLAAGGNAVDAVVAAGFASAVLEPGVSSVGGGGFLLVREPDGTSTMLDFFTSVPSGTLGEVDTVTVVYAGATQDFHVGTQSVAVPGCLDGFLRAHRKWGSLPLADLVAPAIAYARGGFTLEPGVAHAMFLIEPVLMFTPEVRSRMAPNGTLLTIGERLVDEELADFLTRVARGEVAGIADLAQSFEGLTPITAEDVQDYHVIERQPLVAQIRGGQLITNPLPSLGGSIVAHVLGDVAHEAHPAPVTIAEALVETTAWLKSRVTGPVSSNGTTHISTVDANGMCAAMTVSNGLGSGIVLPGTGVHLNNMMGEEDLHPGGAHAALAGTRIRSMMAPSIVEFDDGLLVLGSGGSERIRSALTRVITLMIGADADLADAIEAPRLHVDTSGVVQVEPGLAVDQLAALEQFAPVNEWSERHFYFGGVNAVQIHRDGRLSAHADPRRGGGWRLV